MGENQGIQIKLTADSVSDHQMEFVIGGIKSRKIGLGLQMHVSSWAIRNFPRCATEMSWQTAR